MFTDHRAPGASLDIEELRARLALGREPETRDDTADPNATGLVPAAVLVPIVPHIATRDRIGSGSVQGILLTKRTAHLAKHAGQVSFPGGRIDPSDASPEAAALRESHEEIGLDPALVELLGRLPDHVTGTGYRVTPILGLLPASPRLVPSPDEVETVFELPLSVLLDPDAPQRRSGHYRGRWREFWVWPHPEHYIWGATAAMLVTLAGRLRAPPSRIP